MYQTLPFRILRIVELERDARRHRCWRGREVLDRYGPDRIGRVEVVVHDLEHERAFDIPRVFGPDHHLLAGLRAGQTTFDQLSQSTQFVGASVDALVIDPGALPELNLKISVRTELERPGFRR